MVQILVFGDSIAYGAWDREGGWVHRLRKFVDEKNLSCEDFYCLIYNLGISGDTTSNLLERLELETKSRLKEGEEIVFIFAVGINDSQFIHSQNNLRTAPEKFAENVEKIIKTAQKFSAKIVFVGLFPVDERKTTPIPWNTDKSYKNEYVKKYNDIIRAVCEKNKIYFIDIFDKMKNDYQHFLEDGLHPNSFGHQKIFESVKDFLINKKII